MSEVGLLNTIDSPEYTQVDPESDKYVTVYFLQQWKNKHQ